nr:hypothetical protein [Pirellula sp.]
KEAQAYIDARMGDRLPSNLDENYARETVLLAQGPDTRSIPVQAIEVGDLVIAATPTETFNATGLSVRAKSPYAITMNIGLANDLAGYMPTANEFEVGGYTTWRARSSCLAIDTEARVVETLSGLIQSLASSSRFDRQTKKGHGRSIEHSGLDSIVAATESLDAFELEPGQTISLVACEPQIVDPVALRFDDAGDLWVVEMRDYPDRVGDSWRGRIRVLRDEDCDGFYESSRTFADGLAHPAGIEWTPSGVLVTVGGTLVRLQDTDNDGMADRQEVLLSGFAEENTQLRVNDPEFGLDGNVVLANGLRSSRVQVINGEVNSKGLPWIDISNSDVHFDLREGKVTRVSGPFQFGITWDRYGTRYGCNNRNPCDEVLIESADAERSPLVGLAPMVASVVPPGEHSRVRPLVDAWTTSNLHAGQFTAACGVLISDSHHLPGASLGHALTCEPTGSLVHRVAIGRVQGKSQVEEPDRGREWLASRDPWFRPVFLEEGPDGAIYIADMHRAVIEHPDWVPEELKHRPDQRWGDQAGRIYRVGRTGIPFDTSLMKEIRKRPLGSRTTSELISLLSHPNAWMRKTASQLIEERHDSECVDGLITYCVTSQGRNANGLMRALYALARRDALSEDLLIGLLDQPVVGDPSHRLPIHDPSLRAALWKLSRSRDAAAWSPKLQALAESAIRHGHREEMLAAAWSIASVNDNAMHDPEARVPDSLLQACVERSTELADDPLAWMALSAVCRSRWLDFTLAWGARSETRIAEQQMCRQADWDTWARSLTMSADPTLDTWVNGRDRWWSLMQKHMQAPASTTEAERRTRDEPYCRYMLAMARGILGSKDRSWLVERNEFWKWLVIEAQREDRTPSVRQASIAMLAFAPESMSEANHVLKNLSEQLGAPKVSEVGLLRMAAFQA